MTRIARTLACLAVAAAACAPIYSNHGYAPDAEDLIPLELGVSDRAAVQEALGVPATKNDRYGESWFYVASRFRQEGYRQREETSRKVVVVSFDETGLLSNIEQYELQDGKAVAISRRITETNLGRLSLIQQVLRGLGRIDPASALDLE